MDDKASQIMDWVLIASIVALILVVMAILFGNLSGNTGFKSLTNSYTVSNESQANKSLTLPVFANVTGYSVQGELNNPAGYSYVLTSAFNVTTNANGVYITTIPLANLSLSSTTGLLTNATAVTYSNISISYTYSLDYNSQAYNNTQSVIGNYSQAAVNTAAQLPTIGTITGIALLLAILIGVVVFAVRRLSNVRSGTKFGSME